MNGHEVSRYKGRGEAKNRHPCAGYDGFRETAGPWVQLALVSRSDVWRRGTTYPRLVGCPPSLLARHSYGIATETE
jgi:hypothetical protein